MSKKGFRFDAARIASLKGSLNTIKNDVVKKAATEVTDQKIGGDWPKIIVGYTKHIEMEA